MNLKCKNWLLPLLVSGLFSVSASAEVIYQDQFDGPAELIPKWPVNANPPTPRADWLTIYTRQSLLTEVESGNGNLTIHTEDLFGGVMSPAKEEYNFFDRELTFSFEDIGIEAFGKSNVAWQRATFGLLAYSSLEFWQGDSSFLLHYYGAGNFAFRVKQEADDGVGFDTASRKEFKSQVFNFDPSFLTRIELTLDSVNFVVEFIFGNELDRLTFGGPHGLDRNRWVIDAVNLAGASRALALIDDKIAFFQGQLDQAIANGDPIENFQISLASWQSQRPAAQATYDERNAALEDIKGRTALIVALSSDARDVMIAARPGEDIRDEQGRLGGQLTLGSVTVETTTKFEGL